MSKAVLISIKPKWAQMIASREKTIEVRKTRPKLETPFKCYIYQSGKNLTSTVYGAEFSKSGYVIGEFVCDKILDVLISSSDPNMKAYPFPCTGLTDVEIMNYLGNGQAGYGWHISALKIYDKPKKLSEFQPICKYRDEEGNCRYREIDCDCQQPDFNPDFSLNVMLCKDYVERPPQSFMYVEEL